MQIGNRKHEWYLSGEIVVPLLAAMSIWAFSLEILVRIQSSWSSLWKCPAMKKPSRDYVPGLKTCRNFCSFSRTEGMHGQEAEE
jgi:hypothetical protein